MTPMRWAALAALIAVTVVTLVWRPWDRAPFEISDAVDGIKRLPGVLAVEVEHYETAPAMSSLPTPSTINVRVRVDAAATPDEAVDVAERAYDNLLPAAEHAEPAAISVFLLLTAGDPSHVNGVALHPVTIRYDPALPPDDVAAAFTIWRAGALRVETFTTMSGPVGFEPDDTSDARSGVRIEAANAADMVPLAELSVRLGRSANLRTGDSVSYESYGSIPDVEAVRLAVDTASRPGVDAVTFTDVVTLTDVVTPRLSVRATSPADAPETEELERWLDAHDYATGSARPVAYTIAVPGYATLIEGWVSGFAPPEPEPHQLPLPDGADAWPQDPAARPCTGADLDVVFGGSDAATGGRYALLLARNVSDEPCAVEGIPDVTFRNAEGEAQQDIRLEPLQPGVVAARVVVPPGEQVRSLLQWRANSTSNDPDVTMSIEVIAVPEAEPVQLDVTEHPGSTTGLDITANTEVRLGPWVQALEGWS